MNDFLVFIIAVSFGAGLYLLIHADRRTTRLWSGWFLLANAALNLIILFKPSSSTIADLSLVDSLLSAGWLVVAAAILFCGVKCVLAENLAENAKWLAGLSGGLAVLMLLGQSWLPGFLMLSISLVILLCGVGAVRHGEEQENTNATLWHETFLSVLAGVLFVYCGLGAILPVTQNREEYAGTERQALPRRTLIDSLHKQALAKQNQPPAGHRLLEQDYFLCCSFASQESAVSSQCCWLPVSGLIKASRT